MTEANLRMLFFFQHVCFCVFLKKDKLTFLFDGQSIQTLFDNALNVQKNKRIHRLSCATYVISEFGRH